MPSWSSSFFYYLLISTFKNVICLLCLLGHLYFLLSSHINFKEIIFAQNIYTIDTDQVLFCTDSSPKRPLKFFFLPLFLKPSNSIFLHNCFWLANSFQRYITYLEKKFKLVCILRFYLIWLDNEFPVREIMKRCLPWLEIALIILKVLIRLPLLLLKVVDPNFSNLSL